MVAAGEHRDDAMRSNIAPPRPVALVERRNGAQRAQTRTRSHTVRRDTFEYDNNATGPHEALRNYFAVKAHEKATAICVGRTTTGAITAIRIENGQPSHAGYRGYAGDEAMACAASDGVIAIRTHQWETAQDGGSQLILPHWKPGGEKGTLSEVALKPFEAEPGIEAVERWVLNEIFTEQTKTGRRENPDSAAPGTLVGENKQIEIGSFIMRERHGNVYETSSIENQGEAHWIEWYEGTLSREAWLEAAHTRANIEDRHLGKILEISERDGVPGVLVETGRGTDLGLHAKHWTRHEARTTLLRSLAAMVRMHIRSIAHGAYSKRTLRGVDAVTSELGGLAVPIGKAMFDTRELSGGDNIEMAITGAPTPASDLYGFAATMLEAITGHAPKALSEEFFDPKAQTRTNEAITRAATDQGQVIGQFLRTSLDPYPPQREAASIAMLRSTRHLWEQEKNEEDNERQASSASVATTRARTRLSESRDEYTDTGDGPPARAGEPAGAAAQEPDGESDAVDEFEEESLRWLKAAHEEVEGAAGDAAQGGGKQRPPAPELSEEIVNYAQEALVQIVGAERASDRVARALVEAHKRNKNRLDRFVGETCKEVIELEEREEFKEHLHRKAVEFTLRDD